MSRPDEISRSTPGGRAILLDRDGTLIVEREYLSDPAGVELLPGVIAGLRQFHALGYRLIVVTNQSGIGRGYFTTAQLQAVHARLQSLLAAEQMAIDDWLICPHAPDAHCRCRKPAAGLGHLAAERWNLDLSRCWVIGDKLSDLQFGQALGARTGLVRTGYGRQSESQLQTVARAGCSTKSSGSEPPVSPDLIVDRLDQAAAQIADRQVVTTHSHLEPIDPHDVDRSLSGPAPQTGGR